MLGKLIKYDLKSMNRYLILIHAALLLASAAMRIFLTGPLLSAGTDWESTKFIVPFTLFIILYIMIISAASFATSIVIIVRFYKNLFSAQGYLTRTLPVTSGQHLLAKTISGSIWIFLNFLATALSIAIVAATPYVVSLFKENSATIRMELGFTGTYAGMSWWTVVAVLLIIALISTVSGVITYFASIAIGQLISNHRVLGAIAAYFVITTVISIISLVCMAVWGLLGTIPDPAKEISGLEYFFNMSIFSCALSVILGTILYIATYWIMKKKIDLD